MSQEPRTFSLPAGVAGWDDFRAKARSRLPRFAFEYLDSGIGNNACLARNRIDLDRLVLVPKFGKDNCEVDLSNDIFGQHYSTPFGVAPVGAPGVLCPGAEIALAHAAGELAQSFCLSTAGSTSFQAIAPSLKDRLWFQLYPSCITEDRRDLLNILQLAGINTLIVTIDVPTFQWRERAVSAESQASGWRRPFAVAGYPRWLSRQLIGGRLRLPNIEKYAKSEAFTDGQSYIAEHCVWPVGIDALKRIRDEWEGYLVVKGLLSGCAIPDLTSIGIDGIYISNHGGRQLDAAPSPASQLKEIKALTQNRLKVVVDGGVRSGLDVIRYLSLGADFVLAGRLPYMAVSGLGLNAARPLLELINHQIKTAMLQLGCADITELRQLTKMDESSTNARAEWA